MRTYISVKPRLADYDRDPDGEDYLARTVYEVEERVDIGILDADGNKIMAVEKKNPIGYVWRKS